MAITIKRITLWRGDIANEPGSLARVLEPLDAAKADLQIVMGYRIPDQHARAILEFWPAKGRRQGDAARRVGMRPGGLPTLLVTGDNRAGLGHAFSRAMADAGINMGFLVAQVVGRRYSAVFGFESEADADRAATVLKKAARPAKKRRR